MREWLLQFDAQAEKLVIPALRRAMTPGAGFGSTKPQTYPAAVGGPAAMV